MGVCECVREGKGGRFVGYERAIEIESIVRVQSGENIASFTRSISGYNSVAIRDGYEGGVESRV